MITSISNPMSAYLPMASHLFHCSNNRVIEFVKRFATWVPYEHRVKGMFQIGNKERILPIPPTRATINALTGNNYRTSEQVEAWYESQRIPNSNPKNAEEAALARVGTVLYDAVFKDYTKKQWNRDPTDLEPSVLQRLPVRTNDDDRYFNDTFQALPKEGYTSFVQNMLKHEKITVLLNHPYKAGEIEARQIIYCGPIDRFFEDGEKLEYRSLEFEIERFPRQQQANFVVNYPAAKYPYTRKIEYSHLPTCPRAVKQSLVVTEYPSSVGEPFYPLPTARNRALYAKYQERAKAHTEVYFLGRLARYVYLDMDKAIDAALNAADELLEKLKIKTV